MTRQMKESGIDWIGEIPSDWEVVKLKYKAKVYTGNSIKDDQKSNYEDSTDAIPYISTKDLNSLHKIDYENGMYIKIGDENFKIAPKNSILMCIEGGSAGIKKAKLNQDVCFVNKLCCLFPTSISDGFLYYFINGISFEDHFKSMISGLIGGVSVSDLSNIFITQPSLSEQQKIADYLDKQCVEIDNVIEKTEQSIEEYKKLKQSVITEAVTKGIRPNRQMKDSGIDWIGEIPSEWEVNKIKRFLRYVSTRDKGNCEVLSLYRDLGIVPKNSRDDNHNVTAEDTSNYRFVRKGDFVINKMKAWQGSVAISDYEGIVSPAYFVYEFITNDFDKKYFHFLLRNKQYAKEFERISGGIRIGQWDLPADEFENTYVIIPPLFEQQEIAEYLDVKCSEIDKLIEKKQQIITELEQYKKSMIYEYVTGKREVV